MTGPVLFYDGACGLCDRSVRWVLRRLRPESPLSFAPLQGDHAARFLPESLRRPPFTTVVYLESPAHVPQIESAAIRALAPHVTARGLRAIWPPVANPIYRIVSRSRHRWFGTQCTLPSPDQHARFLD